MDTKELWALLSVALESNDSRKGRADVALVSLYEAALADDAPSSVIAILWDLAQSFKDLHTTGNAPSGGLFHCGTTIPAKVAHNLVDMRSQVRRELVFKAVEAVRFMSDVPTRKAAIERVAEYSRVPLHVIDREYRARQLRPNYNGRATPQISNDVISDEALERILESLPHYFAD